VQEQADGLSQPGFAQALRQGQQVVVVHPDEIVGLEQRLQRAREALVHALVGFIVGIVVTEAVHEVVEQRPQRAIAEAEIVVAELGLVEVDRGKGDAVLARHGGIIRGRLDGLAIPAEPQSAPCLHRGHQAHGEPTGHATSLGYGNTVRYCHQPAHTISSQLRDSRSALPMTPTML
jgi:hypothetical protein